MWSVNQAYGIYEYRALVAEKELKNGATNIH
jgi:hypothetical protein